MGLLRSPGTICQNTQRFVGSNKVIPTFGDDGVISGPHVWVLDQGVGFVKVMRPKVFTRVYDGDPDQLMIRCCQLTRDAVMVARGGVAIAEVNRTMTHGVRL